MQVEEQFQEIMKKLENKQIGINELRVVLNDLLKNCQFNFDRINQSIDQLNSSISELRGQAKAYNLMQVLILRTLDGLNSNLEKQDEHNK